MYIGWLSALSGLALYFDIPPLPDIQLAFAVEWQGTVAAVGTGVAFIAISHVIYNAVRARLNNTQPEPETAADPTPDAIEEDAESVEQAPRTKQKAKKKNKKKRRR